jgi:hypothetical protein
MGWVICCLLSTYYNEYCLFPPCSCMCLISFEDSLRGSGVKVGDSRDMDFANKVQRRRMLQEQKRQAVMISRRVIPPPTSDQDEFLEDECLPPSEFGSDAHSRMSHSSNVASSSLSSSSSSSWWSDLMARKEEAERKGFSSIIGNS